MNSELDEIRTEIKQLNRTVDKLTKQIFQMNSLLINLVSFIGDDFESFEDEGINQVFSNAQLLDRIKGSNNEPTNDEPSNYIYYN